MAAKPPIGSFQDMPPSGGYPKVRDSLIIFLFIFIFIKIKIKIYFFSFQIDFTRKVLQRGPSGLMIWVAVLGATVFGMRAIAKTNDEKRLNHKEARECRFSILPYLMVFNLMCLLSRA